MTNSPDSYRNTRLRYLYCDASNYKARGAVVLAGTLLGDSATDEAGRFTRLDSLPTDSAGAPVCPHRRHLTHHS